jgi:hypothetical protein
MRRVGRSKRNKPHRVTLCRFAKPGRKGEGGRVALFAFSFRDVAELLDLKVATVQKLAKKGVFSMDDLESLFSYFQKRRPQIPAPVEAAPLDPGSLN